MNRAMIIARKEWMDILRSRTFLNMMILLVLLTIVSLSVSFAVFNSQVAEYQKAMGFLKQIGKTPDGAQPHLYPLNLLRGVVDYIEIIGGILGILLGYISVSKERGTKALKLLLTRPVTRQDILYGKLIGNTLFVFLLMTVSALIVFFSIYFIGGVLLTGDEILRLALFVLLSTGYIMIFFMLSFFFSLQQKTIGHALILSFIFWLVFVLILPQIGDTMDPDNQVPGGFFNSMNMSRDQGKKVLEKFHTYEVVRDDVEQLSITKQYERTMFAIFGVKQIYNDQPLPAILNDNLDKISVIFIFLIIGFFLDRRILSKTLVLGG